MATARRVDATVASERVIRYTANMSQTIEADEVRRIAALCSLRLDDDEVTTMAAELGTILAYVDQLSELELDGVPPTAHVLLERIALRSDETKPSLARDTVLEQAPSAAHEGFCVPEFVDEG